MESSGSGDGARVGLTFRGCSKLLLSSLPLVTVALNHDAPYSQLCFALEMMFKCCYGSCKIQAEKQSAVLSVHVGI